MKQYIERLQARHAHEKRHFSMRMAMGVTALIFLVWLSTLGWRLTDAISRGSTATSGASSIVAATAAAGGAIQAQFGQMTSTLAPVESGTMDAKAEADMPEAAPATVIDTGTN